MMWRDTINLQSDAFSGSSSSQERSAYFSYRFNQEKRRTTMKKTCIVILIVGLLSSMAFGQFITGTKTLSGGISWSRLSFDGEEVSTVFSVSPAVGYFVIDNLALKVSADLWKYSDSGNMNSDNNTFFGFGIGGKYHINSFYGGGSYLWDKQEGKDADTSILAEAGYLYGLNEIVFLDIGFNYFMGLGDYKISTVSMGVGVATFF